jgi:hypothetical protein
MTRDELKKQISEINVQQTNLWKREADLREQLKQVVLPLILCELPYLDNWAFDEILKDGRVRIRRYEIPRSMVDLLYDATGDGGEILLDNGSKLWFNLDDDEMTLTCDSDFMGVSLVKSEIERIDAETQMMIKHNESRIEKLRSILK